MTIENKIKELKKRLALPENSEKIQRILRGTNLKDNEDLIKIYYNHVNSLINNFDLNAITDKQKQLNIITIDIYIKKLNNLLDKEGWK